MRKVVTNKEGTFKVKSALGHDIGRLPYVMGRVGHSNSLVTVLRDIDSEVTVKESLCPLECFNGKTGTCAFVDGSTSSASVVIVDVDSPFLKGEVRALAMKCPFSEVVTGNIAGARFMSDPDPEWSDK